MGSYGRHRQSGNALLLICLNQRFMERLGEEERKESQFEDTPLDTSMKMDEQQFNAGFQKPGRKNRVIFICLLFAILLIGFLAIQSVHSLQRAKIQKLPTKATPPKNSEQCRPPAITHKDINDEQHIASHIQAQSQTSKAEVMTEQAGKQFKRIIWVQTDDQLDAKPMEIALAAQNWVHFGKQAGYDVRIVDNLNAYAWLSPQMIAFVKDVHQKSKVDLPVYELLRLALLYEHGGVSARLPDLLLLESVEWVEGLLEGQIRKEDRDSLSCRRKGEVLIHHEKEGSEQWFKDSFITARPSSRLLKDLLTEVSRIAKAGEWPYPDHEITAVDQETEVVSFPLITENLINSFHRQHSTKNSSLCQAYGVQSFHQNDGVFMLSIPINGSVSTFKQNQNQFFETFGKKYLLKLEMLELTNTIADVIKTGDLTFGGGNSMLKNKLIAVEGNRWLATPKSKTRKVHFCIVSLAALRAESYEHQMKEQLARLAKQSFADWNVVNFIEGLPSAYQKVNERVVLVNASQYEGLNLQRAATKYCDPASVMLLLDHDEALPSDKDLSQLAMHFEPIDAFAAFFRIKTGKTELQPVQVRREVRRKTNNVNVQLLSEIGNLMRAFTVESYRFIAAFDLRHSSGRYFDREVPLLAMLELSEHFSPCESGNLVYQARRLQEVFAIPKQKAFTNITIKAGRLRNVDRSRFEYFAKFRHRHLCGTIKFYQNYVAPVETMAVLNGGKEEQGLASRRGMPELIPRKIHQIWVRGEIPNFKKFLMKRLRDGHPDYEYFLWTEENITRENFPEGYDLMQTLLEWDKKSPYNKMSMISDIIRSQAVHAHGGFYLDTNYMLFAHRALDQFLSYSFVTAGELSPRQRMFRDTAIFGATRRNPRLARLISHRTLSSRNFFSRRAAKEAGPGLFGRALRGNEELAEDVFQPALEEFYPNFMYDPGNHNYNRCETRKAPESEILFRSAKKSYLKNCSQIYPFAFGLDFFGEGLSWQKRKWR